MVYLQDSYLYTEEWQPDLPIGHTTRPVERLMADWQGTVFTRPISYLYITVDPSMSRDDARTEYVEVEDPLER